jgi:hypothetical protein
MSATIRKYLDRPRLNPLFEENQDQGADAGSQVTRVRI